MALLSSVWLGRSSSLGLGRLDYNGRHRHRHTHVHAVSSSSCRPYCTASSSSSTSQPLRLIMLRHAAKTNSSKYSDYNAPLSRAGEQEALALGGVLADMGNEWTPQLVLCSNSTRAKQTLQLLTKNMPCLSNAQTEFLGTFYSVSQTDGQTAAHVATSVAQRALTRTRTVLCIGHNKGWEEAASSFSSAKVKLGSATAALLEASAKDWNAIVGDDEAALAAGTCEFGDPDCWAGHGAFQLVRVVSATDALDATLNADNNDGEGEAPFFGGAQGAA
mmetsp:Transcript_4503/g.11159  ORF Transcript_4503/g.11159 Transcript_4503/m.11159 type:complete len:275 (-) Transcript_4503:44-868(-)